MRNSTLNQKTKIVSSALDICSRSEQKRCQSQVVSDEEAGKVAGVFRFFRTENYKRKGATRGYGDDEMRKQGDEERKISLFPPLLVSPSPFFPSSSSTTYGPLQVTDEKVSENARTLPPSAGKTSVTVNVHVPFPFCPPNAASGLAGLNDPV